MFSFGIKNKNVKTGVTAPTSETKASYTIQTALKLEAKALGTLGNAVTVKAEANTSDNLAVSVTGDALTILLANATGSKNTMTLIAAAIAASTPANALVNAIVITGATQMTAFTVQSLSGGVNGSVGYLGEIRYDTNGTRWELKYTTAGVYYWCTNKDFLPAKDTEYMTDYDPINAKAIYSQYREITTAAAGGSVTAAIGVVGWILVSVTGVVSSQQIGLTPINYTNTASSEYCLVSQVGSNIFVTTPNVANINSRPVRMTISYRR